MMKKMLAFLLVCMICTSVCAAAMGSKGITWTEEDGTRLRIGNPTKLRGRFFTSMWGGTTSDMDVQDLLHACSPVLYDIDLTRFRFDHSVVQDAVAMDDEEGNRTYLIVFYDDLLWSDGTRITAADYAFSILFSMDPAIAETGGTPIDCSWIIGAEEYLNGTSRELSGLRVMDDLMLQIRVKAEALPYFYELSRLMIHPYPASVIAPGITVRDDGNGAYFSEPLTAEMIRRTVLDPETGYLSHPSVVSGPYTLTAYCEGTATFEINPYFKGTEEGTLPRIGELEYTLAENGNLMDLLISGEFGLLNKITLSENIYNGIRNRDNDRYAFASENYARSGLTLIWFTETGTKVQETEVRKAIACCFDRDSFVRDYAGMFGLKMDGFYGLAQWMFRLASGQIAPPVDEDLPEHEKNQAVKAYESLSLDGLTTYGLDLQEAGRLLAAAGWKRGEDGICRRTADSGEEELSLVLGYPESEETGKALDAHLVQYLEQAGIRVTLKPMTMEEVEKVYRGEDETVDLLYVGENFSIRFDPEVLAPGTGAGDPAEGSVAAAKAELYEMAKDMVKTDPDDLLGFLRKWIALQERITETLPLLPVYSNVYFDFFSRELHDYRITHAVTWAEAVIRSYIGDAEVPEEE